MNRAVWVLLIVLILGLAVAVFRAKTEADRARNRVATLEREVATLEESNKLLELERAHLAAPRRIEQLARTRLGLAPASPAQTRPLEPVAAAP